MNTLNRWKSVAIVAILCLLVALQPAVTFACNVGSSGHCGG